MQPTISKKEVEKEKKRVHILDTVEQMLKVSSLDSITMDDIAENASISKGALYLHFSSKKELSLAIHNRALETMVDRFANILAEDLPGLELLKKMGSDYMNYMLENPRYLETFMQNESLLLPQDGKKTCDSVQEMHLEAQRCHENATKMFAYLNRCIQVGISDKSIYYEGDSKELAIIYWGGVRGLFQISFLAEKGFTLPAMEGIKLDFKNLLTLYMSVIEKALVKK
jgi:AcrR family transcriptional regulator